jgi:hypothetical protein
MFKLLIVLLLIFFFVNYKLAQNGEKQMFSEMFSKYGDTKKQEQFDTKKPTAKPSIMDKLRNDGKDYGDGLPPSQMDVMKAKAIGIKDNIKGKLETYETVKSIKDTFTVKDKKNDK